MNPPKPPPTKAQAAGTTISNLLRGQGVAIGIVIGVALSYLMR